MSFLKEGLRLSRQSGFGLFIGLSTLFLVGPAKAAIDAFSVIQAENYNSMKGIQKSASSIGSLDNADYVLYNSVNFGSGSESLNVKVAVPSSNAGQIIEVRIDNLTGTKIGALTVQSTGSWGAYQTQTLRVSPTTGVHNLYLIARGSYGVANIDSFQFARASTPPPAPVSGWTRCGVEGGTCTFSGTRQVRYGLNNSFAFKTATGSIECTNVVFGDPLPGVSKVCEYSNTADVVQPSPAPADSTAAQLGLNTVLFRDEFDSNSIGTKWYRERPFGYPTLPSEFVSIANGVLTMTGDGVGPNYSIGTIKGNGSGGWTGFASAPSQTVYFEARIKFDPSYRGGHSNGWPSFWTMSAEHLFGPEETHWGEIDFMEDLLWPYNAPNDYASTVHYHGVSGHQQNSNLAVRTGQDRFDWNSWHTYGTLYRAGKIEFYLDGVLHSEATVTWGAGDKYSILDKHHWPIILGTGDNSFMQVDWVRVYGK